MCSRQCSYHVTEHVFWRDTHNIFVFRLNLSDTNTFKFVRYINNICSSVFRNLKQGYISGVYFEMFSNFNMNFFHIKY